MRGVMVLDRVTWVAPLGMRFVDVASGTPVGDGLEVTVHPVSNPARRVQAFPNRSGIYGVRNLPGLHDVESGRGDAEYWRDLPLTRPPFVVEVQDLLQRFQPFTFTAHPPERGLVRSESVALGSPVAGESSIPLFSAPNRPVPAGMAVVRADLEDSPGSPAQRRPAAWAVLEVVVRSTRPGLPDTRARGVADLRGRVAVVFPYPAPAAEPIGSLLDSPAGATRVPLAQRQWEVALNATYRRFDEGQAVPTLDDELAPLPTTAHLFEDEAHVRPLLPRQLAFGQELIVKSDGDPGSPPPSVVYITPVGSPL